MKLIHQVSKSLLFWTILFGIILMTPSGFKLGWRASYIVLMGIVLGGYLIFKQRRLWVDLGLLLLMLLASPWLINFLNDVFNPYTMVAADCDGHLTMTYRGVEGFLLAPIWTALVGFGYMLQRQGKHLSNRLFALICLLMLLMSVTSAEPLQRLRAWMTEMRPEMRVELPPGCR